MARFFLGCDVGAVPPLRHWAGVPVVMGRSPASEADILFKKRKPATDLHG